MHLEPWMTFIQDLARLLAVAACVNLALGRFRLPIFIGYLLAGVLVSSGLGFFGPLKSTDNLKLWSEIGIIFLLFTIGLEFSISDFFKLGAKPIKTGVFETVGSFIIIGLVLKTFGLTLGTSLGLAACFTISSTAIIMKSFQEYNLKSANFVKQVFGILVFEDIAVILMLLILPTMTVSQLFSGNLLIEKFLLILSFLFFSLILGFLVLPLLNPLLKRLNSEGLLVFAAGLALITSSLSHRAGLSFGIGAFIAGSLLAQLPKREKFLHSIEPIRNLFMAIFFVATGMLLKLDGFFDSLLPALGLSLLVIITKFITVSIGSLLVGESFKNAIKSGLTMTAMGEFTLLTGQLSLNLNLLTPQNFQVVVISVFLNIVFFTVVFREYDRLAKQIERFMPQSLLSAIASYRQPSGSVHLSSWYLFKRFYLNTFGWNALIIAILAFVTQKWIQLFATSTFHKTIGVMLGLIFTLPFFWGLIFYQPSPKNPEWNLSLDRLKRYQGVFFLLRTLISAVLFLIVGNLLLGWTSSFILFLAVLIVLNLMKKEIGYVHRLVSKLFLSNLSVTSMEITQVADTIKQSIWEAQVSEFVVSPSSCLIGMSLQEAQIREKYNVLITAIDRGGRRIYGPARYERIYPGDRLFVFGTEEDILNFRSLIEVEDQNLTPDDCYDSFAVESFDIPDSSTLVSQTIRDSFLRNQGGTLIIGIEREGNRILNPDGQMQLSSGDRIWMAGERNELTKKIKELEELSNPKT
jgi:CPA2 family monovalent cation:H+ antiporter-2